eukprot:1143192-Pelagomonas_calceolata.AAC.5
MSKSALTDARACKKLHAKANTLKKATSQLKSRPGCAMQAADKHVHVEAGFKTLWQAHSVAGIRVRVTCPSRTHMHAFLYVPQRAAAPRTSQFLRHSVFQCPKRCAMMCAGEEARETTKSAEQVAGKGCRTKVQNKDAEQARETVQNKAKRTKGAE